MEQDNVFKSQLATDLIRQEELNGTPTVHLFGSFFLKNEICCLFGDSNVGKSVLCTDIAQSCCGGICWWPDNMSDVTEPVQYFDFETSSVQFAKRFKGSSDLFPSGFERVELNQSTLKVGEDLFDAMVTFITASQARPNPPKVIILDNLTYMTNSVTNANLAVKIMKGLKQLKSKYGLSILIVAHTPKRKANKPITQDDLGGSKMFINFCDSAFAIGNSYWSDDTRYIKHIKARGVMRKANVVTVELTDDLYLHFKYIGESNEDDHLLTSLNKCSITPELEAEIIAMRLEGRSIREIASEMKLSKSVVGRFVKEHKL